MGVAGFESGLASGLVMGAGWAPGGLGASLTGYLADQSSLTSALQWLAVPPILGVLAMVIFQIVLGILTVVLHVQIAIALAHQTGALSLFALMIYFIHRLVIIGNNR